MAESRATAHWKIGLDVDEWDVVIAPRPFDLFSGANFPDQIGSTPWLQAARLGYLDNAQVTVQRAYFNVPIPFPETLAGVTPVGLLTIFFGLVTNVTVTTSTAAIQIKDMCSLLSINMPRNYYQGPCRHVLFDQGCTLNAASYEQSGVVGAGSTAKQIVASILGAPGGSGTYALGRIAFITGVNAGVTKTIARWSGQTLSLLGPLPAAPSIGDTFTAYPGCDKQLSTCQTFGNRLNFGGMPFIPIPEASVG